MGTAPIQFQPYIGRQPTREGIAKLVEEVLKEGVIDPFKTKWASSAVLVPKKDGSQRLNVTYRHRNAVSIIYTSPLPRMTDCIDSLGKAVVLTTLDENWVLKIPMRAGDQYKITF